MVNLIQALVFAFALCSSAFAKTYLAVIETNTQVLRGGASIGASGCFDTAPLYQIHKFTSHPKSSGSSCSWKGTHVATSRRKQGAQMEGCRGGYTKGWGVCTTSYGANVHDGKGRHQRCLKDDTTLYNCPTGICWTSKVRKLRCLGDWHRD